MTHRFLSSCTVDVIYAVNGQTYAVAEVAGFTLELSGNIVEKWSPDGMVRQLTIRRF